MPGTVHTIILNWRTADMTIRALEYAVAAMKSVEGMITVVDNNSGDGSFERIASYATAADFERVHVVQSGHNGGFGAGNNVAMFNPLPEGGMPDYVYLLNSDAFPEPDAIRKLRDYLDSHPHVGLASSRIVGTDGVIHETAFRFPSVVSEFEGASRTGPITCLLSRYVVVLPVPESATEVDWAAGASLMMRRSMLERTGGFDEKFFLYFEETDLCRRARRAGWPTHFVPDSVVTHIGSASTGLKTMSRPPNYWFDSRQHYFRKNLGAGGALAANLAYIAGSLLFHLRCRIERRQGHDGPGHLSAIVRHGFSPRCKR
ncbi:glycosyltransferase family 2 protein [Paracoccus benzoatiresistens]|uniref:Glycosyltransferase family 2 protein n=1 Tax=Paracoccus benzoatiresistens TaxID=2997341 RepID=A0ABT4J882_9RHOB|nr:glycosyltransferase family 2 protein [Paracoccus sp. EF6]MCZ0963325.1 glycosyltransferase family 2 protein [Paracoccus sp. EF6]